MRFRFVGGKDAPEWILAEVSVLSKISCVRLKLITRQVINELVGGNLDVEKVSKLVPKESGFTWSDIKAALAAISYILKAATRHGIDAIVLNAELQQLGLPKENSDGISRPYRIHRDRLTMQASCECLRMPRLLRLDWRVDAAVCSSNVGTLASASSSIGQALVHLSMGTSHAMHAPPPRVAWVDAESTPLLLAARAYTAMNVADGGRTPLAASSPRPRVAGSNADKAAQDLAMIQLGIQPHGAQNSGEHLAHLLSPTAAATEGGDSSSRLAPSSAAATSTAASVEAYSAALPHPPAGSDAACMPRLLPKVWTHACLSASQAAALLSDLRLARSMLASLDEASATSTM